MFDDADEAEQEAAYTANDIKGLKMNAQLEDFKEGTDVIMTLKDERILDGDNLRDGGDQLENIGLVEVQKAKKNNKLKAYNPTVSAYTGLDDDEWNADGSINQNKKGVLEKYDKLVDGQDVEEQGNLLTIGELDQTAAEKKAADAKKDEIRGKIKENLNMAKFNKIAETYTSEEMATFAKPKKKRKKQNKKRESINWDEEEAKAPYCLTFLSRCLSLSFSGLRFCSIRLRSPSLFGRLSDRITAHALHEMSPKRRPARLKSTRHKARWHTNRRWGRQRVTRHTRAR